MAMGHDAHTAWANAAGSPSVPMGIQLWIAGAAKRKLISCWPGDYN
jgi:hypothetical protein